MNAPLVLGILGSARRRGNSWALLAEVLAGAREMGMRTEVLWPAGMEFAPCRACDLCSRDGVCVLDDWAQKGYRLVEKAAALVVSTPIYFGGIPAQLKAFIDRGQPFYFRKYVLGRPGNPRPGVLICVSARDDADYLSGCRTVIRTWFRVLDVELWAERHFAGYEGAGDVGRDPQIVSRARALGRALVRRIAKDRSGTEL